MIHVKKRGTDFGLTSKWFSLMYKFRAETILDKYGKLGVEALREATPKDTGKTSDSWSYKIVLKNDQTEVVWENSNVVDGVNVALILQYGHGTRNGGYVEGIDYINPALKPIFEKVLQAVNKEVSNIGHRN